MWVIPGRKISQLAKNKPYAYGINACLGINQQATGREYPNDEALGWGDLRLTGSNKSLAVFNPALAP